MSINQISLVLADRSVKLSIRILEDLPVMIIGNCEIRTNFFGSWDGWKTKGPFDFGKTFLSYS